MRDDELGIEKRWMVLAKLDPEEFRRFYDKYLDRIYRYCLSRTLDPEVAEDLTAETFLRAQGSLWRFRWQGVTFGGYLFRIAVNLVRQHAATAGRSMTISEADVIPVDPALSPLAEILLSDRQRIVREAVADLDPLGQEIFLLHYWDEMTAVEIAAVLNVPEGTVKTRLRRGREHLKNELRRRGVAPRQVRVGEPVRRDGDDEEEEG